MYIGNTAVRRAAPPRLRDRLQLRRRGPRRVLQATSTSSSTSTASITVADDGRGIPVGVKPDTGKSTLEEVADHRRHRAASSTTPPTSVSAGLHGMGAKAMNALSEWCEAEVRRDGRVYKMEFERGYATSELQDLGPAQAGKTGTTITFRPDPEMFGDLTFDYDTLADRFREIAFLNKGLAITLKDERDGRGDAFQLRGRHRRVRRLAQPAARRPSTRRSTSDGSRARHARDTVGPITVEVALQYTTGEDERDPLLHQQRLQPGRRHAPVRLPHRADPGHQRLRQEGEPLQGRARS